MRWMFLAVVLSCSGCGFLQNVKSDIASSESRIVGRFDQAIERVLKDPRPSTVVDEGIGTLLTIILAGLGAGGAGAVSLGIGEKLGKRKAQANGQTKAKR